MQQMNSITLCLIALSFSNHAEALDAKMRGRARHSLQAGDDQASGPSFFETEHSFYGAHRDGIEQSLRRRNSTVSPPCAGWLLIGCKANPSGVVLPSLTQANMTIEVCLSFCKGYGDSKSFGLEAGDKCSCHPYLYEPNKSSTEVAGCDTPCGGDSSQSCGGAAVSTVYKIDNCQNRPIPCLNGSGLPEVTGAEVYYSAPYNKVVNCKNLQTASGDNVNNNYCDVQCIPGFRLLHNSISCELHEPEGGVPYAVWHGAAECDPYDCGEPDCVAHATNEEGSVSFPNKVKYTCSLGYTTDGTPKGNNSFFRFCSHTGVLTDPEACKPIVCGAAPVDPNGILTSTFPVYNTELDATYRCKDGYTLDQKADGKTYYSKQCLPGGNFQDLYSCQPISCGPAKVYSHASKPAGVSMVTYGMDLKYTCTIGFSVDARPADKENNHFFSSCTASGKFSVEQSLCKKVSCGAPMERNYSSYNPDEFLFLDDTVTYTCDPGYTTDSKPKADGNADFPLTCGGDGTFVQKPKECLPVACPNMPVVPNASVKQACTCVYLEEPVYTCNPGYSTVILDDPRNRSYNEFSIQCRASGLFEQPPACVNIDNCKVPFVKSPGDFGSCVDNPVPTGDPDKDYTTVCQSGYEVTTRTRNFEGNAMSDDLCTNINDCPPQDSFAYQCGFSNAGTCVDARNAYSCNCSSGFEVVVLKGSNNTNQTCAPKSCGVVSTMDHATFFHPQYNLTVALIDKTKTTLTKEHMVMYEPPVTYTCDNGFTLTGEASGNTTFTMSCELQAGIVTMSGARACLPVTCGAPYEINNSKPTVFIEELFYSKDFANRSVWHSCNEGYTNDTNHAYVPGAGFYEECKPDGTKSPKQSCLPVNCGAPGVIANAEALPANPLHYGDKLEYFCSKGFSTDGSIDPFKAKGLITCQTNGTLAGITPCECIECGNLPSNLSVFHVKPIAAPVPVPPNLSLLEVTTLPPLVYPQVGKYETFEGYSIGGGRLDNTTFEVTCRETGAASITEQLNYMLPQVKPIRCGTPPHVNNSQYDTSVKVYSDVVLYTCNKGFSTDAEPAGATNSNFSITCQASGDFTATAECKPVVCKTLPTPAHAIKKSEGTSFDFDEDVLFECSPGYTLNGLMNSLIHFSVSCQFDGTYTEPATCMNINNCLYSQCTKYGKCEDKAEPTGKHVDDHECKCDAGFKEVVNPNRTCENIDDCPAGACSPGACQDLILGYKCLCPSGYYNKTNTDRSWPQDCFRQSCGKPPSEANAEVGDTEILFESYTKYTCKTGYTLTGEPSTGDDDIQYFVKCLAGAVFTTVGHFATHNNSCQPVKCGHPPLSENLDDEGVSKKDEVVFPEIVTYTCETGYTTDGTCTGSGNYSRTCAPSGNFDYIGGSEKKCLPVLVGTPSLPNAEYSKSAMRYPESQLVKCNTGYSLEPKVPASNNFTLRTKPDCTWEAHRNCAKVSCGTPASMPFATLSTSGDVVYQEEVTYTADSGYSFDGKADGAKECKVQCLANGKFSQCARAQPVSCALPWPLPNTSTPIDMYKVPTFTYQMFVTFFCNPGYTTDAKPPSGPTNGMYKITCQADGTFSPFTQCVPVQCGVPPIIPDATFEKPPVSKFRFPRKTGGAPKYGSPPVKVRKPTNTVAPNYGFGGSAAPNFGMPSMPTATRFLQGKSDNIQQDMIINSEQKLKYTCNKGWSLDGFYKETQDSFYIACNGDGTFSKPPATCKNMDDCQGNKCSPNGKCTDNQAPTGNHSVDYTCNCDYGHKVKWTLGKAGWYQSCANPDDCPKEACSTAGYCKDLLNDYSCMCPPGYYEGEANLTKAEKAPAVNLVVSGFGKSELNNPVTCGSGQIVASKSGPHPVNSNCEAYDECLVEVDKACQARVWMRDRCKSVRSKYKWSAFTSSSASSHRCQLSVQVISHPTVNFGETLRLFNPYSSGVHYLEVHGMKGEGYSVSTKTQAGNEGTTDWKILPISGDASGCVKYNTEVRIVNLYDNIPHYLEVHGYQGEGYAVSTKKIAGNEGTTTWKLRPTSGEASGCIPLDAEVNIWNTYSSGVHYLEVHAYAGEGYAVSTKDSAGDEGTAQWKFSKVPVRSTKVQLGQLKAVEQAISLPATVTVKDCLPKSCGVPPSRPFSEPETMEEQVYQQTVQYNCSVGYSLDGTATGDYTFTATCNVSGDGVAFTYDGDCKPIKCGATAIVPNAQKDMDSLEFPQNVTYTCSKGYTLDASCTGSSKYSMTCNEDGHIVDGEGYAELADCKAVSAGKPSTTALPYAVFDNVEMFYKDSLNVTCQAGYSTDETDKAKNAFTISATPDCSLVIPSQCKPLKCGAAPAVMHTDMGNTATDIVFPTAVQYVTHTGYTLDGAANGSTTFSTSCNVDGVFDSVDQYVPKRVSCGNPKKVDNALEPPEVTQKFTDKVKYTCKKGFSTDGEPLAADKVNGGFEVTCQASGEFSSAQKCLPVKCANIPSPPMSKLITPGASFVYMSVLQFQCLPGWSIDGNLGGQQNFTSKCQADGTFTKTSECFNMADCIKVPNQDGTCVDHKEPTGIHIDDYHMDCDSGFKEIMSNVSDETMRVCVNIENCTTTACLPGSCVDKTNDFECVCPFGWVGTGSHECEKKSCGTLPPVANAANAAPELFFKDTFEYVCKPGYTKSGSPTPKQARFNVTCEANGNVTGMQQCLPVSCDLLTFENAVLMEQSDPTVRLMQNEAKATPVYTKYANHFVTWGKCGQTGSEGNCGDASVPEDTCVAMGKEACNSNPQCSAFAVRKRAKDSYGSSYIMWNGAACVSENKYSESGGYWDLYEKKAAQVTGPCTSSHKEIADIVWTGKETITQAPHWENCRDQCIAKAFDNPPCRAWVQIREGTSACYQKYDLGTTPVRFVSGGSRAHAGILSCQASTTTPPHQVDPLPYIPIPSKGGKTTFPNIVEYVCQGGYSTTGTCDTTSHSKFQMKCTEDGSMRFVDSAHHKCVANIAGTLSAKELPNSLWIPGTEVKYDNAVSVTCLPGYSTVAADKTMTKFEVKTTQDCGFESSYPSCKPILCDTLPVAPNADANASTLLFGEVVVYTCQPGYTLNAQPLGKGGIGSFSLTCDVNGKFSAPPLCIPVECGAPRNVTHATASSSNMLTSVDNTVKYTCLPGYTLDGQPRGNAAFTVTCTKDGNQVGFQKCKPVECASPGTRINSAPAVGKTTQILYLETVKFLCNDGFSIDGKVPKDTAADTTYSEECLSDGSITNSKNCSDIDYCVTGRGHCGGGPDSFCVDGLSGYTCNCSAGYAANNTADSTGLVRLMCVEVDECEDDKFQGDKLCAPHGTCEDKFNSFKCLCGEGYKAVDMRGLPHGRQQCDPVECGLLPVVAYASQPKIRKLAYPQNVTYTCDTGYTTDGEPTGPDSFTVACQSNKKMTPVLECRPIKCPAILPVVKNAQTDFTGRLSYTKDEANYTCLEGYSTNGQAEGSKTVTIQCNELGAFVYTTVQTCVKISCGDAPEVDNAEYSDGEKKFGNVTTYTCDPGYSVDGDAKGLKSFDVTCDSSGNFTGVGACNPVSCGLPGNYANATLESVEKRFQETIQVSCDTGFSVTGEYGDDTTFLIKCGADGSYAKVGKYEACLPVSCGVPTPRARSAPVSTAKVVFGGDATWKCNSISSINGLPKGDTEFTLSCEASGKFSQSSPTDCIDIDWCHPGPCGTHGTCFDCSTENCDTPPPPNAKYIKQFTNPFAHSALTWSIPRAPPGFGGSTPMFQPPGAAMLLATAGPKFKSNGNYACLCQAGYETKLNSEGMLTCSEDDCTNSKCGDGGSCVDLSTVGGKENAYKCNCNRGYTKNTTTDGFPTCTPVICNGPFTILNAKLTQHKKTLKKRMGLDAEVISWDALKYTCNVGYSTDGSIAITAKSFFVQCSPIGQLTYMRTCQKIKCDSMQVLPVAFGLGVKTPSMNMLKPKGESYSYEDKLTFECVTGFHVAKGVNSFSIQCKADSKFTAAAGCKPISCGKPQEKITAKKVTPSLTSPVVFGQHVNMACHYGHRAPWGAKGYVVHCKEDGEFTQYYDCKPVRCSNGLLFGTSLTRKCPEGQKTEAGLAYVTETCMGDKTIKKSGVCKVFKFKVTGVVTDATSQQKVLPGAQLTFTKQAVSKFPCSALGWFPFGSNNFCVEHQCQLTKATHADAKDYCAKKNARLCTSVEVSKVELSCKASEVWTATPCPGGYYTYKQPAHWLPPAMQSPSLNCVDSASVTVGHSGRCCADAATDGAVVQPETTSAGVGGKYSIYLVPGSYYIEGSMPNYINAQAGLTVDKNINHGPADVELSKAMRTDQIRIVMKWADISTDLDSWTNFGPSTYCDMTQGCTGPCEVGWFTGPPRTATCISGFPVPDPDTAVTATLDRDDTDGYGPETTTLEGIGKCKYGWTNQCMIVWSVWNYTPNSEKLKKSEAEITIYKGDQQVDKFMISELMKNLPDNQLYLPVVTVNSNTGEIFRGYAADKVWGKWHQHLLSQYR